MPSLSLYIDVQARQFVQGFTNTLPAVIPDVYLGDSLNLTLFFLQQTGVSSAPYTYINYSASTVKAVLGIVAGVPNYGTFCLTDGATISGAIPYNDNPIDVEAQVDLISSWTTPAVFGGIGGPWTITNSINGALPVLTSTNNQLAPSSRVVITQQAAGSSTSPAVNIVRLSLNPAAQQTTWTIAGTPTFSFTGKLTPDPVTMQQLMGIFLQFKFSLQIQVTTGSDVETLAETQVTFLNELL